MAVPGGGAGLGHRRFFEELNVELTEEILRKAYAHPELEPFRALRQIHRLKAVCKLFRQICTSRCMSEVVTFRKSGPAKDTSTFLRNCNSTRLADVNLIFLQCRDGLACLVKVLKEAQDSLCRFLVAVHGDTLSPEAWTDLFGLLSNCPKLKVLIAVGFRKPPTERAHWCKFSTLLINPCRINMGLQGMQQLKVLKLGGLVLTSGEIFPLMPALEELELTKVQIHFPELRNPNLTRLSVSDVRGESAEVTVIAPRLQHVVLGGEPPIIFRTPPETREAPEIQSLTLVDWQATKLEYYLKHFKKVQELKLGQAAVGSNQSLDTQSVASLLESLSGTRVTRL